WSAASMEGRGADAIAAAHQLDGQLPPEMLKAMPPIEFFSPTLLFAYVRFGRWSDALAVAKPSEEFSYGLAMWGHGHRLAPAATSKLDDADAALADLRRQAARVAPDRVLGDNQPAGPHLQLAENVLAADIATRRGRTDEAVRLLEAAVAIEDALPYT